ncbi:TOBE domain-containing protein, partial [Streptomyces sp. SID7499]|nr:TOBE domain-containing protein [Streptomyces sp. SID7499]
RLLLGIRPEKISLAHADEADSIAAGRNRVTGRIVDSSFIGVSTQYVVESPAGKSLQVYEQNIDRRAGLLPGAEVVLHWNPAHTFGLDADQDIDAGVESVEDAA